MASTGAGWKPRNVLARMQRARERTPTNYPAARHAALIAEALMTGGRDMLDSEPVHCGVSIGVTVELFWKLLRENADLRSQLATKKHAKADRRRAHQEGK